MDMSYEEAKAKLHAQNQEQVLANYSRLDESTQKELREQISKIDFKQFNKLKTHRKHSNGKPIYEAAKFRRLTFRQREETHIKYSVIIPVYNAEKYIEKCVCSLLQSAPAGNAEIILVNDGSADSSAKICQRLSAENDCVKFIKNLL